MSKKDDMLQVQLNEEIFLNSWTTIDYLNRLKE